MGCQWGRPPLLLVPAACGFGVSSSHPIQLFLWALAPANRSFPFSRVLQTRRHPLPAPLCSPRQPQNTRPGHSQASRPPRSSPPAAAGREPHSRGSYLLLPGPRAMHSPKPTAAPAPSTSSRATGSPRLAEQLVSGKIQQALAWRSANGGRGLEGGEQTRARGDPQRPPAAAAGGANFAAGRSGSGAGIYLRGEGGRPR